MKFIHFYIKCIKITIFFVFLNFFLTSYSKALLKDQIDFFNVGQGHAVLINKLGAQAPLLIDAGSKSHPTKIGTRYKWEDQDRKSLSLQISNRILDLWKASNNGNLWGKQFFLNVIVTHPDEDHKDLVPLIIAQLEEKALAASSSFIPSFLLGGTKKLYLNFLKNHEENIIYSEQCPSIFYKGSLSFLDESDCITHLFCPEGTNKNTSDDRNRWSIIIRIQVNGMTALLAGDADTSVKNSMLTSLGNRKGELETDILLAPHHGAEGNYHPEWDQCVNPRAIIIGAALMHKHPKGKTLIEFLNLKEAKARFW